jgi:hypothetical protein
VCGFPERAASPHFVEIRLWKVALLATATFGLYDIVWFCKHWDRVRENTGENIWPLVRAFFGPLWAYSLFKHIRRGNPTERATRNVEAGTLLWLTAYLLLYALARLPGPLALLSFFSVVPMLYTQHAANRANRSLQLDTGTKPEPFTWASGTAVVAGVLLAGLAVAGSMSDSASPEALRQYVSEFNKSLPLALDDGTQVTLVSAQGREVTYHVNVTRWASTELDLPQVQSTLTREQTSKRCNNNAVKWLLQSGVRVQYVYTANDQVEIGRVVLTSTSCPK